MQINLTWDCLIFLTYTKMRIYTQVYFIGYPKQKVICMPKESSATFLELKYFPIDL